MAKKFETPEARDAFLAEPRLATLMYHSDKPHPVGVPVWFDWDGETLTLFSGRTSAKTRHITANPNISVLVTNRVGEPEAWVAFDGKAVISDFQPDNWRTLIDRVAPRYWDLGDTGYRNEIDAWRAAPEMFVEISFKPDRIRSGA